MEKDKRRATRRSREAKALQQKQYRQRVIKNKKKEYHVDDEVHITVGTVHKFLERDDIQGEVLPYRGRDLGDTGEDTSS